MSAACARSPPRDSRAQCERTSDAWLGTLRFERSPLISRSCKSTGKVTCATPRRRSAVQHARVRDVLDVRWPHDTDAVLSCKFLDDLGGRIHDNGDGQGEVRGATFTGRSRDRSSSRRHRWDDLGHTTGTLRLHLRAPLGELHQQIVWSTKRRCLKNDPFTQPTRFSTDPFCQELAGRRCA
jgi:hypothetical protein